MVRHLQAIKAIPDSEVVDTLSSLLQEALAGKITGLAYVALERSEEHSADVVGRARTAPLIGLGLARALEHKLARLFK